MRLEDTDRERFVEEGVAQVVDALEWLGLKPDEGFWISEGQHQNIDFVQSERHKNGTYQKYAEKLIEKGLAYRDWSTPEQLTKYREQAREAKKPFIFRKDMATDGDKNKPHVIRFNALAGQKGQDVIEWTEVVRGKLQARRDTVDDFIIIKSDGYPTYNFANVVDDHEMGITHVMRGDEIIPSTPKHLLLYKALGLNPPQYLHLPIINGTDGKKLSKRTGDTNVLDYKNKGYLPEALLNFLALLGWNDGTEQEIFSLQELQEKFKLKQINTSPAIFDQKRLDWISGRHMRSKPLEELYELAKDYWPEPAKNYDAGHKKKVLELVQERLKFFAELPDLTKFFFEDLPVNPELISEHKQLKKLSNDELRALLEKAEATLQESNFTAEDLSERLNKLLEQTGQKPVVLFSLMRIATTQAPASPGLAETMEILSKKTCMMRIEKQLKMLENEE